MATDIKDITKWQPEPLAKELATSGGKFFADSTPEQRLALARLAIAHGLNPFFGHLTLYQGRPLVTADGWWAKAHEKGIIASCRPATKEEREAYGIPDGDTFFRGVAYKDGKLIEGLVAWGHLRAAEMADKTGFKPHGNFPWRMAEKRAEVMVFRKALTLALESTVDLPIVEQVTIEPPEGVDAETGEIRSAVTNLKPRQAIEYNLDEKETPNGGAPEPHPQSPPVSPIPLPDTQGAPPTNPPGAGGCFPATCPRCKVAVQRNPKTGQWGHVRADKAVCVGGMTDAEFEAATKAEGYEHIGKFAEAFHSVSNVTLASWIASGNSRQQALELVQEEKGK